MARTGPFCVARSGQAPLKVVEVVAFAVVVAPAPAAPRTKVFSPVVPISPVALTV